MGNEGSKTKKGSVDSHIETAAKMGVLNLSNRKLEMVPMKVAQCVNLRSLDLSNKKSFVKYQFYAKISEKTMFRRTKKSIFGEKE